MLLAEWKIWRLFMSSSCWIDMKVSYKTSRLHRDISEWAQVSYVGFPATAREIEVQRHTQLLKGLEFITESFSGKLPQGVLIPLSRFLHLPPLRERERAHQSHRSSWHNHSISPGLKLSALIRRMEIRHQYDISKLISGILD